MSLRGEDQHRKLNRVFRGRKEPAVKALTVHPQWAWAIAAGHKPIENRTWATKYRGTLAIHAGSSQASEHVARKLFAELCLDVPARFDRGAIVAVVDLVDCRRVADTDSVWAEGPFCWRLANVRRLGKPVPCRGRLSLWRLPAAVKAAVLEQIEPIA
jgi:hypothetical protein